MTQKKITKDWFIGLQHFLLAGILFPILLSVLFIIILGSVFSFKPASAGLTGYLVTLPVVILGLWIGNLESTRNMKRMYIIKKNNSILLYSTMFFALYELFSFSAALYSHKLTMGAPLNIALTTFEIFLYYIISKIYISKVVTKEE